MISNRALVHDCEWYRVYDIVEGIHASLDAFGDGQAQVFESEVNQLFVEEGIGWQLVDGEVRLRSDEAFEKMLADGIQALDSADMPTASEELHEAIQDLSRRPKPDLSGALHHATAALECVAREVTGDAKLTLGHILKRYPDLLPPPLNDAAAKLWGYASVQGRHAKESRTLEWAEAQMVVGICAVLCSYLSQKYEDDRE